MPKYLTSVCSNAAKPDHMQLNVNNDGATGANGGEPDKPSAMRTKHRKTATMRSVSDRFVNLLGLTGVFLVCMGLAS
jgi:hypothetical protein